MSEEFASFREIRGIGPATEARLHGIGLRTWSDLSAVLQALSAVRGRGDTLRELADMVAERLGEDGDRAPDGECTESVLLRLAIGADGAARRCTLTHVRTREEAVLAGWSPAGVVAFVEDRCGLPATGNADPGPEPAAAPEPDRVAERLIDAGLVLGGARDVDVAVPAGEVPGAAAGTPFTAVLAARRLGSSEDWTTLAARRGTGDGTGDVRLHFDGLRLPPGVHRLRLSLRPARAA